MSLINNKKLFPMWTDESLAGLLNNDGYFHTSFFDKDTSLPAMNVKEKGSCFEIEFAIPGFSKEDLQVAIEDRVLTISGQKRFQKESKEEEQGYRRREFYLNSFKRSVSLPESVNEEDSIDARYIDGILKFTLEKKKTTQKNTKKIIEVM